MGYLDLLIERVPKLLLSKVLSYTYLGELKYEIIIKKFYFEDFLRSLTGIYVDDYQYTTFSEEITGGKHSKIKYNGITIGYNNREHYVHVPDLIVTLILLHYPVTAYIGGSKLLFRIEPVRSINVFYALGKRVRSPFYSWETNPKFSEDLETILDLIGYADVIKRSGIVKITPVEIEKNEMYKMYYFLPLLYTAYYLKNRHTFIESPRVIIDVYEKVKNELKVPDIPFKKLLKKANELMRNNAEALFVEE